MEFVDIYNERHESMNYKKERKSLENGEYRLSSFIWVINDKNEILIQQRTKETKKFPNMWGTTAGGVKDGETSLVAAQRELKEEIGLEYKIEDFKFIGSHMRIKDYVEVYFCKINIDIKDLNFNQNEVQAIKWVSINEFEKMINNHQAISSGYDIFKLYFNNYYNKKLEFINGNPVIVK